MKKLIAMIAICSVLALVFVGMAQAETLLSVPADPQGNRVFTGNYIYKSVGAASSLLEAGFAEADGRGNLVIIGIANMYGVVSNTNVRWHYQLSGDKGSAFQ